MAKPGDNVEINIKSNKHAFIGLLGIDQSSLILRSGNDLDCEKIWNEFKKAGPIKNSESNHSDFLVNSNIFIVWFYIFQ